MRKFTLIVLFLSISLMITACKKNDTQVVTSLKFDVSDLTDNEYSSVDTSELENAQKEDFKKINFTLKVINPENITERNIIFPTSDEIRKLADSNNTDRYWFGSSYSDASNVTSAEYGYEFVFYSKGLDNQDIKDMFGSLKVKVSWYSADSVYCERFIPVGDVIHFN